MSAQIPRSRRKEGIPTVEGDVPDPRVDQWFAFLSKEVDPHLTEYQRGKIRELSLAVLQSTYNRAYIEGAREEQRRPVTTYAREIPTTVTVEEPS